YLREGGAGKNKIARHKTHQHDLYMLWTSNVHGILKDDNNYDHKLHQNHKDIESALVEVIKVAYSQGTKKYDKLGTSYVSYLKTLQ
ncbi:16577_t:CDS:2, partial [Cetraspora pellucida]